ncbi:hypothetical protein GGR56DRAFT_650120 [Xylariaceae sp. FL0804]|nr:hypothetical protein GGR56DRAFT_650120 [Xylariaceae sp. FL0804]
MPDHDTSTPSNLSPASSRLPRTSTSRSSQSHGSYEIGESSTAGGLRDNSPAPNATLEHSARRDSHGPKSSTRSPDFAHRDVSRDLHRRRRSYKPRSSGGFLLRNPVVVGDGALDSSPSSRDDGRRRSRIPADSRKGKAPSNASDESTSTSSSISGLGVHGRDIKRPSSAQPPAHKDQEYHDERRQSEGARLSFKAPVPQSAASPLDVDSNQIVNMALNLSESRRLASRRNISSPLPPRLTSLPDHPTGGSLKQHLIQQRRSSRNISPKPGVALPARNVSSSRTGSLLQAPLEHDGEYTYNFTSSTLTRAQKAKEHLELMAQYRRLLQILPPLGPNSLSRPSTSSPPASPSSSGMPSKALSHSPSRTLGRAYNPLQYIRNRKIRARERMTIDGETQGFGDVSKVTDWIDQSARAVAIAPAIFDAAPLPAFPGIDGEAGQHEIHPNVTRPATAAGRPTRPRIDWVLDPAEMLADAYWQEQHDNRYLIEDRHYSKIFPRKPDTRRSLSHQASEPVKSIFSQEKEEGDTSTFPDLEDAKPTRTDTDNSFSSTRDRARQKLHDLRGVHHKHSNSAHNHHDFFLFRKNSLSETSESESDRRRRGRGRRSGTISASGTDLLEKQMMEMLAKEDMEQRREKVDPPELDHVQSAPPSVSTPERTSLSLQKRQGTKELRVMVPEKQDKALRGRLPPASPIGSGRSSLDVPGYHFRPSLDLDTSRPVSPDPKFSRRHGSHLPTIGMDLSPPDSRPGSPVRNPFSKVKNIFRDRSRERGGDHSHRDKEDRYHRDREDRYHRDREDRLESPIDQMEPFKFSPIAEESFQSTERLRSKSPGRKITPKATIESQKSHRSKGNTKLKTDEQIGLRNLLKGSARIDGMLRGGVSKVTDFIWKKESESDSTVSTDSSDDSDGEPRRGRFRASITLSRDSSKHARDPVHSRRYLDLMPPFKSASDLIDNTSSPEASPVIRAAQVISRPPSRSSRFDQLKPPRIDIRRATPSSSELENLKSGQLLDTGRSDAGSPSRDSGTFLDRPRQTSKELNSALALPPELNSKHCKPGDSIIDVSGGRHWSISRLPPSQPRPLFSKREVARLGTLILSSGIKAMEISRRADARRPLSALDSKTPGLPREELSRFATKGGGGGEMEMISLSVPQTELYPTTARVLSDSIRHSIQTFETSATAFATSTSPSLRGRIDAVQRRAATELLDRTRNAADEADELGRGLVDAQRLRVKVALDTMDKMLRRRRRRFRWVRRAGWLALEWALVGLMWSLWFVVVVIRVFFGVGHGVSSAVRWLLWL